MPVPRRFDRQPPERDPTRINERIRVPEVRLIDENGQQVGIMRTQEALRYAQDRLAPRLPRTSWSLTPCGGASVAVAAESAP